MKKAKASNIEGILKFKGFVMNSDAWCTVLKKADLPQHSIFWTCFAKLLKKKKHKLYELPYETTLEDLNDIVEVYRSRNRIAYQKAKLRVLKDELRVLEEEKKKKAEEREAARKAFFEKHPIRYDVKYILADGTVVGKPFERTDK